MKPVRGIETLRDNSLVKVPRSFKLMKPVRGIETCLIFEKDAIRTFKLMKPVRGIETKDEKTGCEYLVTFNLIKPVAGN